MSDELRIRHLRRGPEIASALPLLVSGLESDEQVQLLTAIRNLLSSPEPDRFVLIEARIGDELVGVVAAQILPGRTAFVFPPKCAAPDRNQVVAEVSGHLCELLLEKNVHVAQALVGVNDREAGSLLIAAGFSRAAELSYMAADASVFPANEPIGDLRFEPVLPSNPRLHRLMEATYQGSLDCPVVDGWRPIEDVVEGYRSTGEFFAEGWFLVRDGQDEVGCLILAKHLEQRHLELVYLGVQPDRRGRGISKLLVDKALWTAMQEGMERVVLAVDVQNRPAIAVYARCGFFELDRRLVLVRKLTQL